MQVIEYEPKKDELDNGFTPWTDEEDNLLIRYRVENKSPKEIGDLLNKSEFVINLRIHLLIYRLHRNGYTASQIRLLMNAELSQILDIIKPVVIRKPIKRQENEWGWFNWTNIWNTIWNSF
jgi:hypothetical protein